MIGLGCDKESEETLEPSLKELGECKPMRLDALFESKGIQFRFGQRLGIQCDANQCGLGSEGTLTCLPSSQGGTFNTRGKPRGLGLGQESGNKYWKPPSWC